MHTSVNFVGTLLALSTVLSACLGNPACPCQSQPSSCPCQAQPLNCPCQSQPPIPPSNPSYNTPCTNFNSNCKNVQPLSKTIRANIGLSPFYEPLMSSACQVDDINCVCGTYYKMDEFRYLQFVTYTFFNNTYMVTAFLVSDTNTPGVFRSQGLYSDSGESSYVTQAYAFGSVSCPDCSDQPITCIYSCPLFSDCSLPRATSDVVYCISDQPYVSGGCLDEAETLFGQHGFQPGALTRPACSVNQYCVTSFNGAPCVNADKVPLGARVAFPPETCDCASK